MHTRISELEVINGLFSKHIQDLEHNINESKRKEEIALETERIAQGQLQQAMSREADLKRKVDELEAELAEFRDGPRSKKMRLSDLVEDGSQVSTPLSTDS